jgi:single-strand DNA-binding protein
MATFNSCQFIGRLGKDPEFNVIASGKPVVKFSLAVDQGKNGQGDKIAPMWLNVVAWDKLAEIVEKYAEKGMQVFVQGRLQMRAYEDKTGVKRQAVDLVASTVQLLEKRTSGAASTTSNDIDPFDPFGDDLPE